MEYINLTAICFKMPFFLILILILYDVFMKQPFVGWQIFDRQMMHRRVAGVR